MKRIATLLLLGSAIAPSSARAAGPCDARNILWAPNADQLYVTGDVACTLTELRDLAPAEVPLTAEGDNVWLLATNLTLEEGATLLLEGSSIGGDVDELRLQSRGRDYVEIRAEWGAVEIRNTKVTSWDGDGPDTDHSDGRAHIRVVSYLDGDTPRVSRMDVVDSDVGYLGHYAAESYGLVWKVRGESDPRIYDVVDVVGEVTDSTIHDNYFGVYTFGAYGMSFTGSEYYDNAMYGLDPHDDSDSLLVEDNSFHDNGNHGFICSKRCDHLIVRGNTSSRNAGNGFMLHRAVTDTLVEDNVAEDNVDAGYAIMDSHDNTLRNNVARGNKSGVRLSVGASGNVIEDNQLLDSTLYGIYIYVGTDPPTINDGQVVDNTFAGNEVRGSADLGIKATGAESNLFQDNVIAETGSYAAHLVDSSDNVFRSNDLGGSYLYATGSSRNTVEDADATGVILGASGASMTFTHSRGRVLDNGVGLPTAVGAEGSSLRVTRADDPGPIDVTAVDLSVTPADGELEATVLAWTARRRVWSTTPGTASTATFVVGGLSPGARVVLAVGKEQARTMRVGADGLVQFEWDVSAPRVFSLTRISQPLSEPKRRWR